MNVLCVVLFLFHLLCCVVEVHSQTAPYLTFSRNRHPIAMRRLHKRVRLERVPGITGHIPSGIYQCAIETVAASGEGGTGRERVYVGLYESGGMYTRVVINVEE